MNLSRQTILLLSMLALAAVLTVPLAAQAENIEVSPLLKKIQAVQSKGKGHPEAISAWNKLTTADIELLPAILAGMDNADVLAENWIRSAAETIAQKRRKEGHALPVAALEKFIADKKHSPRARRLAYELILQIDKSVKTRLIPGMLNDPSLELRRDAVVMFLGRSSALADQGAKKEAIASYRKTLTAARDLDQIDIAFKALDKLGEKVDLPTHFGFLMNWHVIAPFDNVEKKGFDVAYPPEKSVDLKATYQGKTGEISWVSHTSKDKYGLVDLNKVLDKHKGAICYAFAEFISDKAQDVELRLGCINGNKLWLNGQLLTKNHVYHANSQIDQYAGLGRVKKGRNVILLKIAQNEQTESWAQRWEFQLRICDQYGTAILSKNRPPPESVSLDLSAQ